MNIQLLFGCLVVSAKLFAGDPKFPVNTIADELKHGVNAVVREDRLTYEITSRSTATSRAYLVITIFNSSAKNFAKRTIGYDKLSRITMFKASVYDASGTLIKKAKASEIEDGSAYDGVSLYSDNRYKFVDLAQSHYPYTVEFEYETQYKFLYAIDGQYLIPDKKVSVERVSYELIFPENLRPRYKLVNLTQEPKIKKEKGIESYYWSFEKLMPIDVEPYSAGFSEVVPHILAAPGLFEYDGYSGDMNSWESYGAWENTLNEGRDILPEETKQKVKALTQNVTTVEEKAKVLYEYLQSKTRYVSIQLGIGGLQPFEASLVDKVGYGDCKALSNYMVSLLKEAGIKSHYATIKAGDYEFDLMLDFPSHQGNHVVVAVPNKTDTLWLECTSQTKPFAYSGMFTGDRKAFILTEKGGVWVNTPTHPAEINVQSRTADVTISVKGDATATVKTVYAGLQYENDGLDFVLNSQYDKQKKWIQETTDIPVFDIASFKFENSKNKIPQAIVNLKLSLNRFAVVSGKRLMFTPNLMNKSSFIPEKNDARKTDIVRNLGFIDTDTIRYHIPDEIYPEVLPKPVKISSRFGEYESGYTLDQGLVVYTRRLKIKKGRYPANTYSEFTDFYKSINRAECQTCVSEQDLIFILKNIQRAS